MTIHIGLFGLGTVGQGLVTLLAEQADNLEARIGQPVRVKTALVSSLTKKRPALPATIQLTTDPADLTAPDIDLVVEVAGGSSPAKTVIEQALQAGKAVVTANKELLASHGPALKALASRAGQPLKYEAAVAAGIPIISTLDQYYATDTVTGLVGIVNGTSNFILTQMATAGQSFSAALQQAQTLGFAEADPSNDLDGLDAAYKAIILTEECFGFSPSLTDIDRTGIRSVTAADQAAVQAAGGQIKPLFKIQKTAAQALAITVAPCVLLNDQLLAHVANENNAILVNSRNLGQAIYYGPGAGARPTAQAVLADILTILTNRPQTRRLPQSAWSVTAKDKQAYCLFYKTGDHWFLPATLEKLVQKIVPLPDQGRTLVLTIPLTTEERAAFQALDQSQIVFEKEFLLDDDDYRTR
ncbi:homoserine dehydrogenase [Leuconostocaceae bacterium ESL0958]|nr:homoserine dehydrogenase [Leuconostocaceae bacterium ESL0958]